MKAKRLAYVEWLGYHDEVMPSFVHAFLQEGWYVDVYLAASTIRKWAFRYVPRQGRLRILPLDFAARLFVSLGGLNQYSAVLINTLEGTRQVRAASAVTVPLFGVIHNAPSVENPEIRKWIEDRRVGLFVLGPHVERAVRARGLAAATILPVYFGEIPQGPRDVHRIVVQGNFVASKRNYDDLLYTVKRMNGRLPEDLEIGLVGRASSTEAKAYRDALKAHGVHGRIRFRSRRTISFPRFFRLLRQSSFILPLIDRSRPDFHEYYIWTASSSMPLGLGLGLVPIVEEEYARLYGVDPFSIVYSTGKLDGALERAVSMTPADLHASRAAAAGYVEQRLTDARRIVRETSAGLALRRPVNLWGLRGLIAFNCVLFFAACVGVSFTVGFSAFSLAAAVLGGGLLLWFWHDLEAFWTYSIKRRLAVVKGRLARRRAGVSR